MYVNNAYFGAQCILIGPTLGYLEPQGVEGLECSLRLQVGIPDRLYDMQHVALGAMALYSCEPNAGNSKPFSQASLQAWRPKASTMEPEIAGESTCGGTESDVD